MPPRRVGRRRPRSGRAVCVSWDAAAPNTGVGGRCSGETGTGTAIGVAIIYPMLILVIVALHAIIEASRIEHTLQTAADRAARTASLCCAEVDDASDRARNTLRSLECANDAAADAEVSFYDAAGSAVVPVKTLELRAGADSHYVDEDGNRVNEPSLEQISGTQPPMPPSGRVQVQVTCTLPTSLWGRMIAGPAGVQRNAIGLAIVDPFRSRALEGP